MHGKRKPWMWEHLTWPELRDRVASQPLVMLSIASVEDHGPHLPMDVDNFLIRSLCEAAGEKIPEELLLLPHFPFGFETHHMDYPGTIDIRAEHLIDAVADVCLSVAHHGFRRILIANGHGSNVPVLDLAGMGPVNCAPWHSQIKDGVVGDPMLATAESGKRWFDACIGRMCSLVR